MTQRDPGSDRERSPEEIKAEIERARATSHQDVKAIGEKFSADQVKESAKGVISDAKQEGATMMRETKDAALGSLHATRDQAYSSASDIAHGASDLAHELGDRARQIGNAAGGYARRAGGYARQAGSASTAFATANAIPLSLIGIGVGWLALSLRKQSRPDYAFDDDYYLGDEQYYGEDETYMRDRATLAGGTRERTGALAQGARDLADNARGRAAGMAGGARRLADSARERSGSLAGAARDRAETLATSAREGAEALAERASASVGAARTRVTDAASRLGHQAADLGHGARERLSHAQLRTRDFADENPLAVGALAIAAGVGVGLLLPTTRQENRLMGETRDRLVGDARGLLDEARHAGERIGHKAKESAGELRGSLSERVSH